MIIQCIGNDKCYRANTVREIKGCLQFKYSSRIGFIEEKKSEQRLKGIIDLGSGTVLSHIQGLSNLFSRCLEWKNILYLFNR